MMNIADVFSTQQHRQATCLHRDSFHINSPLKMPYNNIIQSQPHPNLSLTLPYLNVNVYVNLNVNVM